MNYCDTDLRQYRISIFELLIGGPNQSHKVNFKELLFSEERVSTNLTVSASSRIFLKIFSGILINELSVCFNELFSITALRRTGFFGEGRSLTHFPNLSSITFLNFLQIFIPKDFVRF
jgi:hypothetical protein